jgi:hypothetical protein
MPCPKAHINFCCLLPVSCSATPPHPEYPSGHQAATWAIQSVLLKTLGRDVPVTFTSESTPHLTREYKSLTAAAKEVGGEQGRAPCCRTHTVGKTLQLTRHHRFRECVRNQ